MNDAMSYTFLRVAIIAYLLGSIPFGFLLVKIIYGKDVRTTGSGNIGATNVARSGSKTLAIITLFLDAFKGSLPVWLAMTWLLRMTVMSDFDPSQAMVVIPCWAALCAVLGHMFPVWLKFKGGKGVATALGVFAVLAPKAILISLGLFVLILVITRYVSLGSIVSSFILPFTAYYFYEPLRTLPSMTMVSAISLLIIVKHHANIRRLIRGSEPRFGSSMPAIDDNNGGES